MKVLVVGDTHLPAVHPGYLAFCKDLHSKFKCDTVMHIGDFVDFHAISNHDKHPDAKGAGDEYELALSMAEKWAKAFPTAYVCEGNHDARIIRQAASVNIPARFLRGYNDLWGTPKWKWGADWQLDDVHYFHGIGCSGAYPAPNAMQKMLMSTVMGHIHTAGGIWWRANPVRRIFGMSVGTGIDDRHMSFKYAENMKVRSILSAGVVIDGVPQHIIMQCGQGEKYNRKRFE